jgi:2-methylcitrate dehydratase PrpD
MSALTELGRTIAESGPDHDEQRELVELHLIDTVGALIASTGTPEGLRLLGFRARGGSPASRGGAVELDLATRCALARASEIDDIHLPSMTTPGAIVIPAALTLAAAAPTVGAQDVTAHDLMAAIIAGYEAMTRLGRTLDGPSILYRGIWPTYFAAPFAVAAVTARLFRLDAGKCANALTLALTLAAPGVGHHSAQSTSRWLAVGAAAANGLAATRAAQAGFTSDLDLMESKFFSHIYAISPDTAALTEGFQDVPALQQTSFKPWCAARQTMAATQGLREILESGVRPHEIDRIEAFVLPPHLAMINHGVREGDRASHLTSLPYCMALAALADDMMVDVARSPVDLLPPIRDFMSRIKVAADERLLADYPRIWPARVAVTTGAARRERLVTYVPGDPARAFSREDVCSKFSRVVTPVIGSERTERMLTRCGQAFKGGGFAALVAEIEAVCGDALVRPSSVGRISEA